ncbi:hypothetical protein [Aeromonas hydrophila]
MDFLAMCGAGLSRLLDLVKLWELRQNHFGVGASYNRIRKGHEIYIRNLNSRPITLEHWVLEWRKGLWPFHKTEMVLEAEDILKGRKIEAYDSTTLRFIDEYNFSTGKHLEEGKQLYIKLHFVGRKRPNIVKIHQ